MLSAVQIRRVSAFINATFVLLVLVGVFIGSNWGQIPGGLAGFLALRLSVKNLLVSAIFLTAVASAFHIFGLTKPAVKTSLRDELANLTKACVVAAIFAFLFPLTSNAGAFTDRMAFLFLPTAIVACFCARLVSRAIAEHIARTLSRRRDLIIVGSGPRAASLYERFRESHHHDFNLLGFVDSPRHHVVPDHIRQRLIGRLEDLDEILMRQAVDEVLITLPAESCYAQIQNAITTCERAGIEAKYFFSDIFELSLAKPRVEVNDNASLVSLKVVHDDARLLVKRAVDLIVATTALILLSPLMLLIALTIKLESPGPVLFVQERYGLRKRRFRMYKFRTMVPNAEKLQAGLESMNEVAGPVFKIRADPRVTTIGRLLRKTSLDELPQFINVLRGEMSLVGPRPLPIRDVSRFTDSALMRRFSVKPGLTCLWQINGRSNMPFEDWIVLDFKYIDEWSLSLDMTILAKTVPAVLRRTGAA